MVEGLPPSFSNEDLKNLFTPFGIVLSASVIRDSTGQSLRMGEVEMSAPRDAQKAKQKLHTSYYTAPLNLGQDISQ